MLVVLALLVGLVAFILLYLIRRAALERRDTRRRTLFSSLIQRAIDWEGAEGEVLPVSFRTNRTLRRPAARQLLISELITGKKALSGSAGSNLVRLYTQLGLEADSLRKLASPAWHRQAQGIQELAQMDQRMQVAKIYRLTNAHNEIIRMEAQAAIVQLFGFDGLRFLDVLVRPLSEWQQIHLLRLLSRTAGTPSGKVREWLQASNPTVRAFARKLIAEHHLEDMLEEAATG
jgi:uncharacterized protein YjiS (DUF1127 family)